MPNNQTPRAFGYLQRFQSKNVSKASIGLAPSVGNGLAGSSPPSVTSGVYLHIGVYPVWGRGLW